MHLLFWILKIGWLEAKLQKSRFSVIWWSRANHIENLDFCNFASSRPIFKIQKSKCIRIWLWTILDGLNEDRTSFSTFVLKKSCWDYPGEDIFAIFSLGCGFLIFKFMKKVHINGLFEDGVSQTSCTFRLFVTYT